jgi:hypothetical protein
VAGVLAVVVPEKKGVEEEVDTPAEVLVWMDTEVEVEAAT